MKNNFNDGNLINELKKYKRRAINKRRLIH